MTAALGTLWAHSVNVRLVLERHGEWLGMRVRPPCKYLPAVPFARN